MRLAPLAAALALAGVAALTSAAPVDPPPAPTRWVTDGAGLLSAPTRDALDARLEAFEREHGHQVLVYIGRTTGGLPIEDFAVRAFAQWRVGRKGLDDGLVLFVFSEDRRLRVEVGYGLEGAVPDALAGRIVRDVIAPRLAEGQADAGLTAGVDALLAAASGGGAATGPSAAAGTTEAEPGPTPGPRPRQELGWAETIVFGLIGLVFLVILITNPHLALWLIFNVLSAALSGGGGGGGGSRGGFSGGGGRSGGGGASGSW